MLGHMGAAPVIVADGGRCDLRTWQNNFPLGRDSCNLVLEASEEGLVTHDPL